MICILLSTLNGNLDWSFLLPFITEQEGRKRFERVEEGDGYWRSQDTHRRAVQAVSNQSGEGKQFDNPNSQSWRLCITKHLPCLIWWLSCHEPTSWLQTWQIQSWEFQIWRHYVTIETHRDWRLPRPRLISNETDRTPWRHPKRRLNGWNFVNNFSEAFLCFYGWEPFSVSSLTPSKSATHLMCWVTTYGLILFYGAYR